MPTPSLVILYVDSPPASATFYAGLLGGPVLESTAGFAMVALCPGLMLGLWSRHTVEPAAGAGGGGGEIAFRHPDVDGLHADWSSRGLTILQGPADMDFGRCFTAADPDGHRLRVFAPAGA